MSLRAFSFLTVLVVMAASACTIDTRVATIDGDGGDGSSSVQFKTLRAGATLPDEASCTPRVRRSAWEPRPANTTANHRVPVSAELAAVAPWDSAHSYDNRALALQARVTGAFTGTTDEILQWVACKWGFDEDLVRAEAVESSGWTQGFRSDWTSTRADCPPDADTRQGASATECAKTYGILQITWQFYKSAWPLFRDSTPFHVDYAFGLRRVCFEGLDASQASRAPAGIPYAADDEWGCMGAYFSGLWYDDGANAYVARVKGQLAGRAWTRADF
jgi:hypothetical protein